jgi:hypothetical protein
MARRKPLRALQRIKKEKKGSVFLLFVFFGVWGVFVFVLWFYGCFDLLDSFLFLFV